MKTRILVVDDDEEVVKSCKRALESNGYEVEGEIDAEKALGKLKVVPYDLMITELVMLKLDGIRLIRNAKIINPAIGVIVLTGYPSPEAIRDTLQVGAIDFLAKPFFPKSSVMSWGKPFPTRRPPESTRLRTNSTSIRSTRS